MKRLFMLLLAALCLAAAPLPFFADSDQDLKTQTPDLKYDIVVTANRVETPRREVASSVLVLTRTDLERTHKTFVLEALQELAGLSIQENGPIGSAATVMLRGANSEHTLVLMDGVELNDPISPSRSFDFGHLLLSDIERIEVILGPQSPLFGSDAMGGVISIITRRGEGPWRLSLSALGGSYGTGAGSVGFQGSRGGLRFSFDTSYLFSSGFSAADESFRGNTERDGYRNLSLSGRVGCALGRNWDFDLTVRNISTRTDLDDFGGDYGDDPNSRQDYDLFSVRGLVRALLFCNRWEQRLSLSYVSHHRLYDNPVDALHPYDSEHGTYDSRQATLDWQNTIYAHETNIVTFGVEAQHEDGRSDYFSDSLWGPSESLFPLKSAQTLGIYMQDEIRLGGCFFAAVGGRLDHHSRFGNAVTYRVAPAYVISATGTKLKMTLGTGFKSPSLYELYAPGTVWGPIGNANLKPETSVGWDAGLEQTFLGGKITLGATYFHNDFRDLVEFDYARGYTNVGRAESKGVEVFAAAQPVAGVSVRAGYTRTLARDLVTGLDLLRRPKDKFTCGLFLPLPEGLHLAASLVAVGPRDDLAYLGYTAVRTRLRGYTLLNAVLSRDLGSLGRVFVRLDNILNQTYETVYGYGMPRFSIYAGFEIGLGNGQNLSRI
jgi:vitamin B12 transporter